MFRKITDPVEIYETLRKHMGYGTSFIAGVVCNKGKLTYEGIRVLSLVEDPLEHTIFFTLTNSDSKYTKSIGTVEINEIDYLQLLPEEYMEHK